MIKVCQEYYRGYIVVLVKKDKYARIEGKQLPTKALSMYGETIEERQEAIQSFINKVNPYWQLIKNAPGKTISRMIKAAR